MKLFWILGLYLLILSVAGFIHHRNWAEDDDLRTSVGEQKAYRQSHSQVVVPPVCSLAGNAGYPWWRIDLEKTYTIFKITIYNKDNFHDDFIDCNIQIRVGDVDIATSGSDSHIFLTNDICVIATMPEIGINDFVCEKAVNGRYVSIQVVDSSIWYRNVKVTLQLCEVLIFGIPFDKENMGLNINQTEIITHDDLQELTDVCKNEEFDKLLKKERCIFLSTTRASIQIELEKHSLISEMVFEADEFSHYLDIRVSDENLQSASLEHMIRKSFSCFAGKLTQESQTTIKCKEHVKGQFLTILFRKECSSNNCTFEVDDNFNATICGLEIWGEISKLPNNLANVALHKPVVQSSLGYNGYPNKAVDGDHITQYYYHGMLDRPSCTHTSGTHDLLPWWRVDLREVHVVLSLDIHNRNDGYNLHTRLHDIDIRIGNIDIQGLPFKTVFQENFLCKSLRDKFLNINKNTLPCLRPLLGRYVSIQITQLCKLDSCHSNTYNMLTLCEVEVFGYPLVYTKPYNIAVNKSYSSSIFPSDLKKGDIYEMHGTQTHNDDFGWISDWNIVDYPWWNIDFQFIHVVEGLTFYIDHDLMGALSNSIEVRVGFVDISTTKFADYKSNTSLCMQLTTYESLLSEKQELKCQQPMIGIYLTVQLQEKCTNQECLNILLAFVQLDIWGYNLNGEQKMKNLISSKGTNKGDLNYALSVISGIIPKKPFDYFGACSYCALKDGAHPRWVFQLDEISEVHSVVLYNRKDEKSKLLHNIEIYITPNKMPTSELGNPIHSTSQICAKIQNIVPKGRSEHRCKNALNGSFVEIRTFEVHVSTSCPNSKLCQEYNRNVLSLCGIEVFGINRQTKINGSNVATFKPTLQSKTDSNAGSSLAVDGKFFPRDGVLGCSNIEKRREFAYTWVKDCDQLKKLGATKSGIYSIYQLYSYEWKQVYCDMVVDDGGWMVVDRRGEFIGEEGEMFDQREAASSLGFGNLCKEFWIGTATIKQSYPADRCHQIRIDIETTNGTNDNEVFFVVKLKYKLQISVAHPSNENDSKYYKHLKNCLDTKSDIRRTDEKWSRETDEEWFSVGDEWFSVSHEESSRETHEESSRETHEKWSRETDEEWSIETYEEWTKKEWLCFNLDELIQLNESPVPGMWDPRRHSFQPTGIIAAEIKIRECPKNMPTRPSISSRYLGPYLPRPTPRMWSPYSHHHNWYMRMRKIGHPLAQPENDATSFSMKDEIRH